MLSNFQTFERNNWVIPQLVLSVFFFITITALLFRNKKYRACIGFSTFISAISSLVFSSIVLASPESSTELYNTVFIFHGIHYTSIFYTIIYALRLRIKQTNGRRKAYVIIAYIWMILTLLFSITITVGVIHMEWIEIYIFTSSIYDIISVDWTNRLLVMIITVVLFRNRHKMNSKTRTTMIIYILLVLITAICTSVFLKVKVGTFQVLNGLCLFFVEMPIKMAGVVACYYGPQWVIVNEEDILAVPKPFYKFENEYLQAIFDFFFT